jgi:hypothetical protein
MARPLYLGRLVERGKVKDKGFGTWYQEERGQSI